MNDLIISVEKKTRMVMLTKTTIGNDTENLQEKLIFKFTDTFVDGQGRLEYKMGADKNYIVLTKENNTYTIPVQNVITKEGRIEMQLVITEGTEDENIPVFKSNVFYLYCNRSLNAVNEAPEGYDLWIEQANAKLNAMDEALTEVDNLDIDASKSGDTATLSITNKEGITKSVSISDGKDAKINGVNTLSIEAGTNITLDQEGNTLTINSTGGGGGASTNVKINGTSITSEGVADIKTQGEYNALDNKIATINDLPDISGKQDITDNSLQTINKTVPNAINEVNSIAKGANQAVSYSNYSSMITAINAMDDDEYNVGQNLYVVTVEVPDLWVSSVESTSSTYTYVDDATVVNALETNGYIQVGYYKLSMLETQKVDLTNYVTNTNYATGSTGGVIKTHSSKAIGTSGSGLLYTFSKTYADYQTADDSIFIGKATLENVITGKGLVSNTDYATSSTGGVLKVSNGDYGITVDSGVLKGTVRTYAQYSDMSSKGLVAKGTLENVLTNKGLNPIVTLTQTEYDNLSTKDPDTYYYIVEE